MTIKHTIQKLAAFREGVKGHPSIAAMAKTDPERLGRFWAGRYGSVVAAIVADALDLSGAALTAFNRGCNAAIRAA